MLKQCISRRFKIACFLFFFAFCGTSRIYSSDVKEDNTQKLNSIGLAIGTAFGNPWFIANVHNTFAPFKHFFVEPGIELGLWQKYTVYTEEVGRTRTFYGVREKVTGISGDDELGYRSFYPFLSNPRFADNQRYKVTIHARRLPAVTQYEVALRYASERL